MFGYSLVIANIKKQKKTNSGEKFGYMYLYMPTSVFRADSYT